jgi:hypothetical protein
MPIGTDTPILCHPSTHKARVRLCGLRFTDRHFSAGRTNCAGSNARAGNNACAGSIAAGKRTLHESLLLLLTMAGLAAFAVPTFAQANLQEGFKNPPASARPHTWWHWINGNVTKEGITADLEAMKRVGIGGAQIFNVDVGIPAGKAPFMSPPWREAVLHAAREAQRLGLELCVHNCAGWSSSGGPWITPEHAMQILTWSETPVHGPGRFEGTLPQPRTRVNYYRDIAVFAVRKPAGEQDGNALRIAGISAKAAFERGDRIDPDASPTPEGMATPRDGVVVLTEKLGPDGRLVWEAPAGEWTLLRLGYTPTGKDNHPAPAAGRGLECDKLSREAMDAHWGGMIATVLKDLGPLAGKTLNNVLIDSYEVGSQNWTPKFREEFQKRRGYDPLPYLPVVTGRVLESTEISERFLWDLRRTVCDLFADNYYGYLGELCRQHGLKFSNEPYGNGSFDNLQIGGTADIPMGEFWVGGGTVETTKLASSAGHTYGRKIIGAESFTADTPHGRWLTDPYSLKPLGDRIFSLGVNRYIFHRYAHQPWLDLKPGMTMGPWGTHLERTQTWWDQGAAWLRYVARCQYLLQSGRFVADVVYFTGDDGPNDLPMLHGNLVPYGYDYDGCDAAILQQMRVEDGQVVLPSGMRYRVLALPASAWMTPKSLQKVKALAEAGATIYGPKPGRSPSLQGFPACDAEVQQLAKIVWGDEDGKTVTEHACGKGRVIWGRPLGQVLASLGAAPDVDIPAAQQSPLVWIHRATEDTDLYFVANQRYRAGVFEAGFRVTGKSPELWYPETGVTEPAPVWREENGHTRVSLRLGPAESVFVIFRQPATGDHLVAVTRAGGDAAQPTAPRVEIRKAFYEALDGAGGADVTAKVAAMVEAGETEIPATNTAFGDPTPLHVKRLRVVYVVGGKPIEKSVGENETLDLGGNGGDDARPEFELVAPGGRTELRAWTPGTYAVKTATGPSRRITTAAPKTLPIGGAWTLRFPPNLGAPPQVTLDRLISWTEHANPGVRYFSGSATYEITFDAPGSLLGKGSALYLDLGRVKNFAEVWIDGKPLETLWKAPFCLDVTGLVKPGRNTLRVRVTNLWPNRLIGDEQLPDEVAWKGDGSIQAWPQWLEENKPRPKTDRVTFTTWRFWQKDSPLLESGLIGPVTLYAVPRIAL